jgi:hypothetical protein
MNEKMLDFIHTKQIDSFQKLRLLLFLTQNPNLTSSLYDLAGRLCLADVGLVERLVADLASVGLLIETEPAWKLCDEPEIKASLGKPGKISWQK